MQKRKPEADFSAPGIFNERTSGSKNTSRLRFLHGHVTWAASLRTSVAANPTSATRKINAAMFARIRCSKSSGPSFCKSESFRERSLNSYRERSSRSQMLSVEASSARFAANAAASRGRNLAVVCGVLFNVLSARLPGEVPLSPT